MSDDILQRKPLDFITSVHEVRPVYPWYVETIKSKIETMGVLSQHPMVATSDGKLWAGRHRFEAIKALGIKEAWFLISDPECIDKAALDDNDATADALPNQMPDLAELVWRRLDNGSTQQSLAADLGWSRSKIANYAQLASIADEAWKVIVTAFRESVTNGDDSTVTMFVTVATLFTERLLRDILPLLPWQQLELCGSLAAGEINKSKFKTLAVVYGHRNDMVAYLRERLPQVRDEKLIGEGYDEIWKGWYDKEWPKNTAGVDKLAKTILDKWEKANRIQLRHGDFFELAVQIADESVDLVLTDPPYNLAHDRVMTRYDASDVSYDFGEWDKQDDDDYIEMMRRCIAIWWRVMAPGATGIVFTSTVVISDLRRMLKDAGFKVKQDLYWCKSNPVPALVRTGYTTCVEPMALFTKGDGNHVFNWPGDENARNYFVLPLCQGDERIKDAKGSTMHPTQKPECLIKALLENSSRPGDMVLDGFMGVGTVPAVAKSAGRKAIGIELDERYHEAACRRIDG